MTKTARVLLREEKNPRRFETTDPYQAVVYAQGRVMPDPELDIITLTVSRSPFKGSHIAKRDRDCSAVMVVADENIAHIAVGRTLPDDMDRVYYSVEV